MWIEKTSHRLTVGQFVKYEQEILIRWKYEDEISQYYINWSFYCDFGGNILSYYKVCKGWFDWLYLLDLKNNILLKPLRWLDVSHLPI